MEVQIKFLWRDILIKEHEIPNGSKLYFGKSALIKRELENKIASILLNEGFEEIVTPHFSYTSQLSIEDETKLIKINDEFNNQITLRFDSTIDVARIVTKRLGRETNHKKWFYIQPVFSYPTNEEYQVGVEWLNEDDFKKLLFVASKVLNELKLEYSLQLCNIKIPKLIANELNLEIEIFKKGEVNKLFDLKIDWLKELIAVKNLADLEKVLKILPSFLIDEVKKLHDCAIATDYKNILISPLFYAPLKYYEDLYFRVIEKNFVIIKGGSYKNDGLNSIGFSISLDNLVELGIGN